MYLNNRRFSMRIHLADIIDTETEKILMTVLADYRDKFEVPVLLKFWYRRGEVTEKAASAFFKRYGRLLAFYGAKIYCTDSIKRYNGDKAWLNVVERKEYEKIKPNSVSYRFSYVYDDETVIWGCVDSFLNLVNFHSKEKPQQKKFKKRTFNEGSNSRKS